MIIHVLARGVLHPIGFIDVLGCCIKADRFGLGERARVVSFFFTDMTWPT